MSGEANVCFSVLRTPGKCDMCTCCFQSENGDTEEQEVAETKLDEVTQG